MEDHVSYYETPAQSVFLSEEDVIYLTGYSLPSKQREHLERMHIPFFSDKAGHPRVLRSHLDPSSQPAPPPTINFDKLHAMLGR